MSNYLWVYCRGWCQLNSDEARELVAVTVNAYYANEKSRPGVDLNLQRLTLLPLK